MITPSYSITATERVLPKLVLDFTTATLDPRITFTRALNTATCVNSSGYVATVNANLPRFDYNPVTKVCNGLLIEEARTNICLYSSDYTQSNWTKTQCTIAQNATTSPANVGDAQQIVENTATNSHNIRQFSTITSGATSTFSCYVKAAGRTKCSIRQVQSGNGGTALFDLTTGTLTSSGNTGTGTNTVAGISNAGNGWYRLYVTVTTTGITSMNYDVFPCDASGATTYTGDGVSGLYVWGCQFEVGAFPTSVIPTDGTVGGITRNADVATMTGTNFSSWYNQTAGTFEAEFIKYVVNADGRIWWIDDGSVNNVIDMSAGSNGKLFLEGLSGGVYSGNIQNGTLIANTIMKACVAYSNATTEAASLSAATTTTGNLTLPSSGLTRAAIGYQASIVGTYFNGWIRKMNYYSQRLTDNEVQAFSK